MSSGQAPKRRLSPALNRQYPRMQMLVLQLALPPYRQSLITELEKTPEIVFASGDSQFQTGVTLGVKGRNVVPLRPNRYLFWRTFAAQKVKFRDALSVRLLVIELNPRVFNSWIYATTRRLLGKKTLAWGHVYPRSGPRSKTDLVRRVLRRIVDGMIVYTAAEAGELARLHPRSKVYIAHNALYSSSDLAPRPRTQPARAFVMIGRLIESKKPHLVIDAFRIAVGQRTGMTLELVGSGPLEQQIRADNSDLIAQGCLVLHGQIDDVEILRSIFDRSIAMVCGGYVGLNVTQALGFGVPVLYCLEEPHAPEVNLLSASNSIPIEKADDVYGFAEGMISLYHDSRLWASRSSQIADIVRRVYSTESMAQAFRSALSDFT